MLVGYCIYEFIISNFERRTSVKTIAGYTTRTYDYWRDNETVKQRNGHELFKHVAYWFIGFDRQYLDLMLFIIYVAEY